MDDLFVHPIRCIHHIISQLFSSYWWIHLFAITVLASTVFRRIVIHIQNKIFMWMMCASTKASPPVHGWVDYNYHHLLFQSRQTATTFVSYWSTLVTQTRVLRSSTSDLLSTQSSSTNIAARRFSCCTPAVWNSLPSFGTHCWQFHLRLSLRLTWLQEICSRSTVRASDTLTRSFIPYVTYLHKWMLP